METPALRRVVRLDSIKLDDTYFTDEGYLVDHPIVTSCGIFEYTNPDGSIRRELRLPENVFDDKSLASYEGKPVIITHDAGEVNKNNVEDEHIGTILSKGYRDGNDVRAKIIIHDTDAMRECGLRELSLGYDLTLDETPGDYDGQPYDAIQRDIVINHLALVGTARAGEQARLNIDGETPTLKGAKTNMKDKSPKKTRRDNVSMSPEELQATVSAYKDRRDQRLAAHQPASVEATAEDNHGDFPEGSDNAGVMPSDQVQLVKDRRDRRDQVGDPETTETAQGIIAQQDEDIDALLEVIESLQAKSDFDGSEGKEGGGEENADSEEENKDESQSEAHAMNADSIDRIISERLQLARIGDRLHLDGLEKMKPIEAKKAIIRKVKPQMRFDGKGVAYINAAFDLAVDEINSSKDTDYQRRQMMNTDGAERTVMGKTAAERAREKMIAKQNGGNEK